MGGARAGLWVELEWVVGGDRAGLWAELEQVCGWS